ncbi:MAG: ATP-binding protein [Chitinophagaceae bacterium]|nr:ATP-binding protein [Chitinophagaceae bacterium]
MNDLMGDTNDKNTKIPFKVSARTAKLIGLENFTNEEGAIVELVKNTYDADAKNCVLVFDLIYNALIDEEGNETKIVNKEKSKIFVMDNGHGMTDTVITNQWMTLGTDDKLYEHTSKGGRVKTGAKGIGRFALNRLGLQTKLFTLAKEKIEGWQWQVDWKDFDKKEAVVSDILATLTPIPNLNLSEYVLSKFANQGKLFEFLSTISFTHGTVIEISELNDLWNIAQLEKLFANLEMLLPPTEQTDFQIDFFVTSSLDDFGTVKRAYYDDFDYKINATRINDDLEIIITRNELDLQVLENRYSEIFDYEPMKVFPYRLADLKTKTITLDRKLRFILSEKIEQELIDKVGDFSFTFYFLKNTISDDKADGDLKKYPYKGITSATRKSWLKKFGGIKIFRDDFRVRPYGENGLDWLKLGERQAQSPGGPGQRLGGYRIGPNQIAGTVKISRLHNSSFEDKSGREGIIENDVFELFKNILLEIIGFFEKDRNTIMYHLSELNKFKNKEEEKKRKAQEEAERVKKEQEEKKEREQEKEKKNRRGRKKRVESRTLTRGN